jgi:hypothetical protein
MRTNAKRTYTHTHTYTLTHSHTHTLTITLLHTLTHTHTRAQIKATLVLIIGGVGIATVTDMEFRLSGLLVSLLAVLFTAQFQIWAGSKQKQHQLGPLQMTYTQAYPMSATSCVAALLLEGAFPLVREGGRGQARG